MLIVAGKGNNGGDGLVVARLLKKKRIPCEVALLARRDELSPDAAHNLRAFVKLKGKVTEIHRQRAGVCLSGRIGKNALIVDAILGTGIKNEVRGFFAEAITLHQAAGLPIVAIDIPSGLDTDKGMPLGVADSSRDDRGAGVSETRRSDLSGSPMPASWSSPTSASMNARVEEVAPQTELLERETVGSAGAAARAGHA